MDRLALQGVEGIILGCTEIPLLINQKDTAIPLFDTLEIHAKAAVDFAISSEKINENSSDKTEDYKK